MTGRPVSGEGTLASAGVGSASARGSRSAPRWGVADGAVDGVGAGVATAALGGAVMTDGATLAGDAPQAAAITATQADDDHNPRTMHGIRPHNAGPPWQSEAGDRIAPPTVLIRAPAGPTVRPGPAPDPRRAG